MDKLPLETNIVIVNDFDFVQGGASKVAIDTANLLVNNGYNVSFFSGMHSENNDLDKRINTICTNQGEALNDRNKFRGVINGIYNFKAKKIFKEFLKSLDKEKTIIHVHGWTKCLSSSIFDIAFKMEFKVVLTLHDYFTACPNGGYFNYPQNEICHLKPLSWKCVKCNCDSRNYFFKLYRIVRQFVQNKIVKLNDKLENVITISDFSENILKKTLKMGVNIYRAYNPIDIPKNEEVIDYTKNDYYLYVGRVCKEKGVDIFCQAIHELNRKGIVVGDGDLKTDLEKKYPNIQFVGWKSHDEVLDYMKKAKAFVFPSRWYETAGLTVLEAQGFGLPIIVSGISASKEFCPSKCDLSFYPVNAESLINTINKFEKLDMQQLSKYSLDNYSEYIKVNYATKIIESYRKMLGD